MSDQPHLLASDIADAFAAIGHSLATLEIRMIELRDREPMGIGTRMNFHEATRNTRQAAENVIAGLRTAGYTETAERVRAAHQEALEELHPERRTHNEWIRSATTKGTP